MNPVKEFDLPRLPEGVGVLGEGLPKGVPAGWPELRNLRSRPGLAGSLKAIVDAVRGESGPKLDDMS